MEPAVLAVKFFMNIAEVTVGDVRVKNEAAVASQRALFEVLWGIAI